MEAGPLWKAGRCGSRQGRCGRRAAVEGGLLWKQAGPLWKPGRCGEGWPLWKAAVEGGPLWKAYLQLEHDVAAAFGHVKAVLGELERAAGSGQPHHLVAAVHAQQLGHVVEGAQRAATWQGRGEQSERASEGRRGRRRRSHLASGWRSATASEMAFGLPRSACSRETEGQRRSERGQAKGEEGRRWRSHLQRRVLGEHPHHAQVPNERRVAARREPWQVEL